MNFEDLAPEIRRKAEACATPEEILALAKEEGYELSEEELQDVSGGIKWRCSDKVCSRFAPCPLD